MNIIGKMLIVMIFAFSLLSMCFAGAVFSVGASWKAKAEGLEKQLASANQGLEDVRLSLKNETKALADGKKAAEDARDEAKAALATKEREEAQTGQLLLKYTAERDKAIADAEVAGAERSARVAEAAALNKELQALRTRNSELNKQIQTAEDEILDTKGGLTAAIEKEQLLLDQIGRLRQYIIAQGDNPDDAMKLIANANGKIVEPIDGVVEATEMTSNGTQQLVAISVGSDDNVFKDMIVKVYYQKQYLAKARVIKVLADSAHCLIDEKSRNGRRVQRGDIVTTKL